MTFPAELFEQVFKDLLPRLRTNWQRRNQRILPESIQFTCSKFEQIWIVDSSILEALFRKLSSLEENKIGQLAEKISTVMDLVTRLPVEIYFTENARESDIKLGSSLLTMPN